MKRFLRTVSALLMTAAIAIACAFAFLPTAPVTAGAAFTYRAGANGASASYQSGRYYKNLQQVTLTGDGATDVLAVALSQLGYQENTSTSALSGETGGNGNYTEYCWNMGDWGAGYGGSSYPWCATFVSWALLQAQVTDQNTMGAWCRNHVGDIDYIWREIGCAKWASQLQNFGYYKTRGSYTPKSGDLIFFRDNISHIGIVVYCDGSTVYTIEGNTSSGTGIEANGGGVYYKSYSVSNSGINGYGTLPYKTNASAPKVDYSGANKTTGLYIAKSAISAGSFTIPQYAAFSVTSISGGNASVHYNGSTGTVSLANAMQITANAPSGGGNVEADDGIMIGIDVSSWQGDIDWAQVKQSGVEFAMLRMYSHASSTHTYTVDTKFAQNVAGATAQNIHLGAYFFSYANNLEEVKAEANMVVELLNDYPATFAYPIVFDAESTNVQPFAADACNTFCDILEDNGYFAMVYANSNWLNNIIPSSSIPNLALWQAHYKNDYAGYTPSQSASIAAVRPSINSYDQNVRIWQYTDQGSVSGISGNVDMDISYCDYTQIIPKEGFNGYPKGSTVQPEEPENLSDKSFAGYIESINGVKLSDKVYKKGQRASIPLPAALGDDCILSLDKGWISVDGGQGDFYYSVDNGKTWQKASGTRAVGESAITSVAQVHGVGTCELKDARYSDVKINLSEYREQTLTVLIAVAPTSNESERVAFMTVTGVEVPAMASAPETPDEGGEETPVVPDEGGEETPTNPDESGENEGENTGTNATPEAPDANPDEGETQTPDEEATGCVASAHYGIWGIMLALGAGYALRKRKEHA